MSTAYFPIISCDFFPLFFSLPSSPHDFFQMWAILYLCTDWKQILLPGVHFNGQHASLKSPEPKLYNIQFFTNPGPKLFLESDVHKSSGRISITELNQIRRECELDLVTDGAVEIKGALRMEATAACLFSSPVSLFHALDRRV